ncbi:MAG: M23 family metallopeptidase [Clostridia bacterium]|nr:M23 family metallopeptidase [Clostridia bacterium]
MKQERSVLNFFKRNAAYIVLALCVLAIGLSITLVMINRDADLKAQDESRQQAQTEIPDPTPVDQEPVNDPVDQPDVPVVKVITFVMPVAKTTAIEDYTDTVAYNATLKRYEAHKAIDFFAEEGTPVYAAYDGVICDVQTTLLTGTTITVDHGDGLYTVYNSLADGDKVFVGQTVKQGTQIGEVSVSNRQEAAEGAHLHFQVKENGEAINPDKYLSLGEK